MSVVIVDYSKNNSEQDKKINDELNNINTLGIFFKNVKDTDKQIVIDKFHINDFFYLPDMKYDIFINDNQDLNKLFDSLFPNKINIEKKFF